MKAILAGVLLVRISLLGQVPEWAVTHTHRDYPPATYLIGVGSGDGSTGLEAAKRLAQADIAAQLRLRVQIESRRVEESYHLDENDESYADFRIRSSSIVDEELSGVEVPLTAFDTAAQMTYALAVLDRKKFAEEIGSGLNADIREAAELRRASEKRLSQGKVADAAQDLLTARDLISELLPRQALYDALAQTPFKEQSSLAPRLLTSEIVSILSKITIKKIKGDRQRGRVGEVFAEPLTLQVSVAEGDTLVPVPGAKFAFAGSSGVKIGEATSDAGGVVAMAIMGRAGIGNFVRARLSIPTLEKDFAGNLDACSVKFSCSVTSPEIAFALRIDPHSDRAATGLKGAVAAAVRRAGYQIVDMSRFVLQASVASGRLSTEGGADAGSTSVSSTITITLIDNQTGGTMSSLSAVSKGVGRNKDDAVEKSVETLRIDEENLLALLGKAKN